MDNFKYFKLGVQGTSDQVIYALYQPGLDCFLILSNSLSIIRQLRIVLTSRYTSQIVTVSDAENFTPTIIDNEVCERWSLGNKDQLILYDGLANLPVVPAGQLLEKTSHVTWDIVKEKQWAHLCMFYLVFLERVKSTWYAEIDLELSTFLPLDNIAEYLPIESMKQIMNILYFGLDLEESDQKIQQIIEQEFELQKQFPDHCKAYY
jgi:hypothetical protein